MRRYIVIEGCIGVGKSTLCRLIRDSWGAHLVMEPDSINPFLELYYKDPERFAFPVQMFYLITRWRQQQGIRRQQGPSGREPGQRGHRQKQGDQHRLQ